MLPLGGLQLSFIKDKLAILGPVNTGHTATPSWNFSPSTVIVFPVAVVALAPQNSYSPSQNANLWATADHANNTSAIATVFLNFILLPFYII